MVTPARNKKGKAAKAEPKDADKQERNSEFHEPSGIAEPS
jgi:hypothetical protein